MVPLAAVVLAKALHLTPGPLDDLERQISKENVYTLTPTGVTKFADFMYRTGMIQQRPASWKEIFFDTVHNLPGN